MGDEHGDSQEDESSDQKDWPDPIGKAVFTLDDDGMKNADA